jgi:hypothetical protein
LCTNRLGTRMTLYMCQCIVGKMPSLICTHPSGSSIVCKPTVHRATMDASTGITCMVIYMLSQLIVFCMLAPTSTGQTPYMDMYLEPGHKLVNNNYSTVGVISPLECAGLCSLDTLCMSFNFNNRTNGQRGLCELNSGSKQNASLIVGKGYTYGDDVTTQVKQV